MRKTLLLVLCLLFSTKLLAQSNGTITFMWGASPTPNVNYNLYQENMSGSCTNNPPATGNCTVVNTTPITPKAVPCAANSPVNSVCWTFNQTPGTTFLYVVRAVDSTGAPHSVGVHESVNSNEVTATIPPVSGAPQPPTTFSCTFIVTGSAVATTCTAPVTK